MALTEKSRAILEAIAEGRSYEQILGSALASTYKDIFHAAAEALVLANSTRDIKSAEQRLIEIRSVNPRAYEKWTPEEDRQLRQLFADGKRPKEISEILQRQRSAISSRLTKFNLIGPGSR
jgi:DNA-binding NarL/FixJ family response regulator